MKRLKSNSEDNPELRELVQNIQAAFGGDLSSQTKESGSYSAEETRMNQMNLMKIQMTTIMKLIQLR
nr:hypothetical protein [Mycoplasmopsis bovis]